MTFQIKFHPSARREFTRLPARERERIAARIDSLSQEPRPSGCRRLKGTDAKYYRIRVGDYRVVYDVADKELLVLVIRVRHRSDAYR